jgi:hypothetical protein
MLQTAREVACLSYEEAAARLGREADWLVRVETGFAAAGPEEVARILRDHGRPAPPPARPVPDAGLLKGVPVGQVAGQPVDVADDDHVDLAGLGAPVQLGRHRFGGIVGLAQTAVQARPELGLRPVCPRVVHESSMTQNHSDRMRRLVAVGLLPERAGQPVKAWVHISLADLMLLDGDSARQEEWTAQVRQRRAAHRARASETGSNDGAWLDGDAVEAIACDAAMAPIVTGDVNVDALEDLVRLCVELDGRRDGARDAAWAALEQAVIGKTTVFLLHLYSALDRWLSGWAGTSTGRIRQGGARPVLGVSHLDGRRWRRGR